MKIFSRRDFLNLGSAALSGAVLPRRQPKSGWPQGVLLGRVTPRRVRLISRPHPDGARLDYRYEDDVVQVLRSVVGQGFYPHNHVWFETPDGYAYSSWVQPVRFDLNEPLLDVKRGGIYVELSLPYSDARAEPSPEAPVVYRLYYASTYQVIARHAVADGSQWYQLNDENGVKMYGQVAATFRVTIP